MISNKIIVYGSGKQAWNRRERALESIPKVVTPPMKLGQERKILTRDVAEGQEGFVGNFVN